MTMLRMGREVADLLGVSTGKARQIARTDPTFPALIDLGPRTKLVPAADLLRYVEGKRVSPQRPPEAKA